MLSDVYNVLVSIFENNSHLFVILLFPVILSLFISICKLIFNPYIWIPLSSSRSSSSSSDLPDDADAYVLDSHGVLVPVYSFDRGD